MHRVCIVGATTWGNTVGALLAKKKMDIRVWAKTETRARELNEIQKKLLKDDPFASGLTFTSRQEEAVAEAEMIVFAVPAQTVRQTARQFAQYVKSDVYLISLAKGLEASSGKRMTEVLGEELPQVSPQGILVLSGPNLSQEISRGLPASSILAAVEEGVARRVQGVFDAPDFAVFLSDDVVGVEICGSLKNVIALGAGMVDGLVLGNNAKSTLITLGWNEAVQIGTLLGAKESTFYGLAGLGDLITTSAGSLSRNHYVGREVATGRPLAEVKASMSNIAEGVDTTMALHRLNHRLKLELPVIELVYKILFLSFPAAEMARRLKYGFRR
ncbi:MAG TPA: NAD(P)H-dependent glycerol-3-phosphate dehydrogenase [Dehalococcoidia bacterium]|nr:NAD(P)H-dependent glycerol-3-phosphate dehydrogenase [Dehalococcoidia bacterium]